MNTPQFHACDQHLPAAPTQPLVSVCMPCYNAEAYVAQAVESVLAQTYPNVELVVVNDGSRDGSAAILESFAAAGVKVLHQANAGQCAAANAALAAASGELVKFFDADDVLHPQMIERQVAALAGQAECVAFGEWARFYGSPDEARFDRLPMYRTAEPLDWLTCEWATGQPMMQCAMFLIPRELLHRTGGWDERLSLINDFEFFARVLLASRSMVFTPGARLYYRSGVAGSLSRTASRRGAESAALSLELGTSHLLAAEDSPRTHRAAANVLQTFEHTFYPAHADLRRRLAGRIRGLGGANLVPPGPPGFQRLRPLLGWKLARRVQQLAERHGLNGAARRSTPA